MTISDFENNVTKSHDLEFAANGKMYTIITWGDSPFAIGEQYKRGEKEKPLFKANTFDELLDIPIENGITVKELLPYAEIVSVY